MLNYSAMKSLRGLVFALFLFPLPGFAQGVRMTADFLPLDVGRSWTYDVTDQAGQKVGQIAFAVEEYTIVSGTSFYVLSDFPFSNETGEPVRYIRYDRSERYFVRKLRNDEGPLFLGDGASTEVIESDASGAPQKFVLRMDKMTLTFQRGVGIVEVKTERGGVTVTAKLVDASGKGPAGAAPAGAPPAGAAPAPVRVPITKEPIVIPPPEPTRREPVVATVTSQNPRIDVGAVPMPEGYRIVMIVTNVSDKILPFQFRSSQSYDFVIHDASNKEVWRWSKGNFFTQVVRSDSIRPNGKWQFEVVWNRKDNDDTPVPAGQYRLTGIITSLPAVQAVPVQLDVQ
jgi:Intracellular proteinase inhibitor